MPSWFSSSFRRSWYIISPEVGSEDGAQENTGVVSLVQLLSEGDNRSNATGGETSIVN